MLFVSLKSRSCPHNFNELAPQRPNNQNAPLICVQGPQKMLRNSRGLLLSFAVLYKTQLLEMRPRRRQNHSAGWQHIWEIILHWRDATKIEHSHAMCGAC